MTLAQILATVILPVAMTVLGWAMTLRHLRAKLNALSRRPKRPDG